jgi:hypothetical protein
MSTKDKPQPVGTCPCPHQGCTEVLQVFKYRERSGRGSMFKGKFYGRCPNHGRVIDASIPASQEHVLERGEIWGALARTEPTNPVPAKTAEAPVISEVIEHQAKEPEPEPAQEPAPEPRRGWLRGWSLWEWWPTKSG